MKDFFIEYSRYLRRPEGIVAIAAAAVVFLNLIFGYVVLGTQQERLDRLEAKLREYESMRAVKQGQAAVSTSVEELRADIKKYKERLPDESMLTKVVAAIDDAAERNSLEITRGNYTPEPIDGTSISGYRISFSVEGRYREIKRFVYELETMEYPLAIEELVFSRSKGHTGAVVIKIGITTYYI